MEKRRIEIVVSDKELSVRIECKHGSIFGTWEDAGALDIVAWRFMVDELKADSKLNQAVDLIVIEEQ